MLKNRKGQVLVCVCAAVLLAGIIGVGASWSRSALPSQDSRRFMYKEVLAAVRKRAPNYWRTPSGPGLVVSCVDFRANQLAHVLCAEYNQMFQLRVPGADIAPVEGKPNTGSATVDMLAGRVKIVVYLAHGDCKWNAAVRRRTSSSEAGTGHFPQMVEAVAEVAGSDMEQGLRHMRSLMTNPTLSARLKSAEVEFVGLFLDADGSIHIFDQGKWVLICPGQ